MNYKVTVLHTSCGASFATHGPVVEDARPNKFTTTVEAKNEDQAKKKAEQKAMKNDYYYGRTLSIEINQENIVI